jgi:hypothetical protein
MQGAGMIDILEIRDQPLSMLLSDFMICTSCKIVDRDHERITVGHLCQNCGVASKGGRGFFPMSVHSLIDLMQDFYHLRHPSEEGAEMSNSARKSDHQLAIVILFCTLGEVLLQHFLETLMSNMGLSQQIQERLLSDNMFVRQRTQKVFPTLTGAKWNETIGKLSGKVELNYIETIEFYKHPVEKRNYFLHRGSKWAIPRDMPEKCIRQIWPILNLFVSLHNEFIAQPLKE